MKKIITFALASILIISGCSSRVSTDSFNLGTSSQKSKIEATDTAKDTAEKQNTEKDSAIEENKESEKTENDELENNEAESTETIGEEPFIEKDQEIYDEDALVENPEPADSKSEPREYAFSSLNDPELLDYYEQAVYADVSRQLGPEYMIQQVSTVYISDEYIEELTYNSQSNIFFGYTLAELDAQFQGTRYVFTLDDNGETIVIPFAAYDDTYERILKNVAIGTGVILICVTVSVVTAGAGIPAVSMIFAASAKSGAIFAASSGAMSAVITGAVTGIQTGDFNEAVKAGALAGSESFKWGAISGALTGGGSELIMLKTATKGGLTMNEAAAIIQEQKVSANFVKQIHSIDEYNELVTIAEINGLAIQDMAKASIVLCKLYSCCRVSYI